MKISDTTSQDTILEPRPRRTRLLWISFGAAVLLMTVWMTAPAIQRWSQAQESVSESRLRLATVTRGDFVRDISVQGRVVAAVSPVLYASDMGTITFAVESGDSV